MRTEGRRAGRESVRAAWGGVARWRALAERTGVGGSDRPARNRTGVLATALHGTHHIR
jgi:hypothetical protein